MLAEVTSGHRWYLLMVVQAKVYVVLCDLVCIPPWVQVGLAAWWSYAGASSCLWPLLFSRHPRDLVLQAVVVPVVLGWPSLLASKARSLEETSAQVDCSQSPSRPAGKVGLPVYPKPISPITSRMTKGYKTGCTNQLAEHVIAAQYDTGT